MKRDRRSAPIRGILLDIAGVLEQDRRAVPGSVEAVRQLREKGYPVRLVTNTSRRPSRALHEALSALGYAVEPEELFTAPLAIRRLLEERGLEPFLLAVPALREDFEGLPASSERAVVLCDAAEGFTYEAMNEAFALLLEGAPLLAVGVNRHYRSEDRLVLDAGPFVRALEYAAEVEAEVVGKPSEAFFGAAIASLGCAPSEVLMVGDDVESDVIGAIDAGARGCLVRTGKYRPDDEARLPEDATIADDLAAFVESL